MNKKKEKKRKMNFMALENLTKINVFKLILMKFKCKKEAIPLIEIASWLVLKTLDLSFSFYFQEKFIQLLVCNFTWCIDHDVSSGIVFRESDVISDHFVSV